MNLDNVLVGDIEADGLLDTITKIHVLSLANKREGGWFMNSTNDMDKIKSVFTNKDNVIVMHNGRRYDVPAIEKVLGIKVTACIIDSLAVAWWVYPNRTKKYGLAEFGEEYGTPKPEIEDWVGLTYEEYKHRCEQDVVINTKMWVDMLDKLRSIYDSDEEIVRLFNMLNFIMDCSYNQEEQKVKVDVELTTKHYNYFNDMKEEKLEILKKAMPSNIKTGIRKKPSATHKKDGSLSVSGAKWFDKLQELGLPQDTEQFEDILSISEGNPNSSDQKKKWLFDLGWKPETFKYVKEEVYDPVKRRNTFKKRAIPQITNSDTKMLCHSVKKLIEVEPAIEALDGLTVITHRLGILKGFLAKRDENDMVSQGLTQLAVTMRWQHAVIVNIPKYTGKKDLRDGHWLRSCLIAQDGTRLVQADLSGVESRTSDHYTFKLNPDRILKTKQDFYDPHTEISVTAGLMTQAEELFYVYNSAIADIESAGGDASHLDYKNFSFYKYDEDVQKLFDLPDADKKEKLQHLKGQRGKGKTTNYASLYKVGAETLSTNLKISTKEAQNLIDAYWEVHWAVKVVSESFKTKKVNGETWIFNPVSKFWYFLRNDKDKFSVVNQSTAVFCFNMWVWFVVKRIGYPITQTHDDLMMRVKDDEEVITETQKQIKLAIEDVNKHLKLNVKLDCEVQNGRTFAETH